ncbi:MAG: bifunctional UDP-N-acetylglucosamine diphosphorylase/glucosamine-1-phosphate N-acetyltransferase GlmU [Candidatus Atribacteria bacterium]|nr:bifunctional UDP-N-acetylglucosamine diphosphorylase/glucosamine-1-phosphate N-acetyltransferase GlmU [Candidatus Atribacteria bacterium]
MEAIESVILAAGQGKRMKSSFPKALHCVAGKPMISYSLDLIKALKIKQGIVVIGHQAEEVKNELSGIYKDLIYVYQEEQLGTAHALQQTKPFLSRSTEVILVLSADVPLLRTSTIRKMILHHVKNKLSCTLLTANFEKPEGYGRIVRDQDKRISGIIEQADLARGQDQIKEVNAGVYCFNRRDLFNALSLVVQDNKQKEYYLTDVIKILAAKGYPIGSIAVKENQEIIGVNTRSDLANVSKIFFKRNLEYHMTNGVTVIDPESTFIDGHVKIGQDTIIYPFTIITAGSEIGKDCHIGPYSHIINSCVGQESRVHSSVIEKSKIGERVMIGPYSHLRPDSMIGDSVKIGNYVEIKKTIIGNESKVSHLTYLGDATLGQKVNIGAGTITCNFDGIKKNPTIIEDGVFIGSNNALVAPVTIGRHSYTAAGSTITQDVPMESLGIARSRQKNIPGWVKREKKQETQ